MKRLIPIERTWLRRTVTVLACIPIVPIIALAALWIATSGDQGVPRTVADDPALPRIEVGGDLFHGETRGDPANPVVIALHGGPGNDYRSILPLEGLADEFFVVFYDQRGAGLSPRVPDEQLTLERYLGDLDGVVERYGRGRPVHLVGHSWGAMLASAYLGRHPEKVARAVLAEPGFLTSEMGDRFLEATNHMMPREVDLSALVGLAGAWLRSLHVDGPDGHEASDYLMHELMSLDIEGHPIGGYFCGGDISNGSLEDWRYGAAVGKALLMSVIQEDGTVKIDLVSGVERFAGPVLFLAGSCNELIGADAQRLHMRHFRDARLAVIEGAGHTMIGEKPEESLRAIRDFLSAP
jgi:proline iminopeptidase